MPTLTWERANGPKQVFDLVGPEVSIGRDAVNAVHLDSTFVSKRHAVIRLTVQGHLVVDLGSSNGTYVNDRQVSSAVLADGDRLKLGSEVLVFSLGVPARPPAARGRSRVLFYALLGVIALLALVLAVALMTPAPAPTPNEKAAVPGASEGGAGQASTPTATPGRATPPSTSEARPAPPVEPTGETAALDAPLPAQDTGALYDLALANARGGRLLDARRLLLVVLAREPAHAPARERLREIEGRIEAGIEAHMAAAQRAFSFLRFEEAVFEWEQVVSLTASSDERRRQAQEGITRARARLTARDPNEAAA